MFRSRVVLSVEENWGGVEIGHVPIVVPLAIETDVSHTICFLALKGRLVVVLKSGRQSSQQVSIKITLNDK